VKPTCFYKTTGIEYAERSVITSEETPASLGDLRLSWRTQQALNERKVSSWEAGFNIEDNFGFKFTIQTKSDRWAAGDSVTVKGHNWSCSPKSIRVTKRKRVRWTGHVEITSRIRYSKNILIRIYEGRRSLVRLDVDFQYTF